MRIILQRFPEAIRTALVSFANDMSGPSGLTSETSALCGKVSAREDQNKALRRSPIRRHLRPDSLYTRLGRSRAQTFLAHDNPLGLPPSLRRCLGTNTIIESPQSGVMMRTRRLSRRKDGAMVGDRLLQLS